MAMDTVANEKYRQLNADGEFETDEQYRTRMDDLLIEVADFLGSKNYELNSNEEIADLLGAIIEPYTPKPPRHDADEMLNRITTIANISAIPGNDGFIESYNMPVGPIHAAFAYLQRKGYPTPKAGESPRWLVHPDDEDQNCPSGQFCTPVDACVECRTGE